MSVVGQKKRKKLNTQNVTLPLGHQANFVKVFRGIIIERSVRRQGKSMSLLPIRGHISVPSSQIELRLFFIYYISPQYHTSAAHTSYLFQDRHWRGSNREYHRSCHLFRKMLTILQPPPDLLCNEGDSLLRPLSSYRVIFGGISHPMTFPQSCARPDSFTYILDIVKIYEEGHRKIREGRCRVEPRQKTTPQLNAKCFHRKADMGLSCDQSKRRFCVQMTKKRHFFPTECYSELLWLVFTIMYC